MTIADFSRDVAPTLSALFSSLALVSILLMWWQIRKGVAWNRLSATRDHYNDLPTDEEEIYIQTTLRGMGMDPYRPLTDAQVLEVFKNTEFFMRLRLYLNKYEVFCAAISSGMVDSDYAKTIVGDKVVVLADVFRLLIEQQRVAKNLEVVWIEIESLADEWRIIRKAETEKALKASQKMKKSLNKIKIVKPRY